MLTVQNAAERLNVSAACVYALVARNDLPHVRIGTGRGTIRILESDLDDYVSGRRQGGRAESAEQCIELLRPKLKHLRIRSIPR